MGVCCRRETLALGNSHPAPGNAKRRRANQIGRSAISEQENLMPLEQEAHCKSNDIGRRSECGRGVQSYEVGLLTAQRLLALTAADFC
jgi:hypothetical protein